MSYTVLAVKWRPRRFSALVGQADVVRALVNSLSAERLHHAYLFTGTRGVGKTTIARILAKALNCESGVSAEPCGECGACAAIDEGRFVDLIEVDAASRTKVEDTRELLDNVQYMPSQGRFKVYLIDEVHMLSTHSFNALLKTLEEPPPHVKFLLATTDPQKLPVTVLSRCLQFNLKKIQPKQIADQLATIVASEQFEAEPAALEAIARSAEGSMRDALSLLDQAIAFSDGDISSAAVNQMLGSIDHDQVLKIIEALVAGNGAALLEQSARLDEQGVDFSGVLAEIMSALQQIAVCQLIGPEQLRDEIIDRSAIAGSVSPEDVQVYYQIALNGRRDLAACRDERISFEMTLLRMLAFRPLSAGSESIAVAGQAQGSQLASSGGRRARASGVAATASEQRETAAKQTGGTRSAGTDTTRSQAAGTATSRNEVAAAEGAVRKRAPKSSEKPAAQPGARDRVETIDDWHALVKAARLRGAVRNLAENCVLVGVSDGVVELVLDQDKANFNTQQLKQRLESALVEHLQRRLVLKISAGEPPAATPAQVRRQSEDERIRDTREAIEQDPNIQAVQAAFDAVLEPDSIQPASTDPGTNP